MKNETKWSVDQAHTEITFKVRHLMIAHVKGSFKTFDASIYTKGKDFTTADIDLWIDTASITTGNTDRDEHLKGVDFFDVKKHKQITFTSNTIANADAEGSHELWGELTMKGITRNVKLNVVFGGIVHDPWGNEKAGFTVTGIINRSHWELNWNTVVETTGVMVSDDIHILCEVELTNIGKEDLVMEITNSATKSAVL